MDLKGKCVLLGVSGGIAAYKMANVASALRKLGADVEVIMTKNATQFITPNPKIQTGMCPSGFHLQIWKNRPDEQKQTAYNDRHTNTSHAQT